MDDKLNFLHDHDMAIQFYKKIMTIHFFIILQIRVKCWRWKYTTIIQK